jgi:hypothetical protein
LRVAGQYGFNQRCVQGFNDPKVIGEISTVAGAALPDHDYRRFSDPKEGWTGFEACYVQT